MIKNIGFNREQFKAIKQLKKLIWLYFFLLIFEGALRKWVLPGLSTPLLIVRDPVAFGILFLCFYHQLWKPNLYVGIAWLVTFIGLCTALIFGHGYFTVAVYGMRIMLLHFPLIFIIGRFFDREDLLKMGNVMLWLTIGMTILVALQFYSPQNAWVNRGIGGDLGTSNYAGAEGFYRVPGTFSFTNGLAAFYGLATSYIFYLLLSLKNLNINKFVVLGATLALVAAVPLSISRTVFFQICLTLLFILIASFRNAKLVLSILGGGVILTILFLALNTFSFFNTATSAFTARFERANTTEGGVEGVLIDRFLGGMLGAVEKGTDAFFGQGIGLGTQAGARLATGQSGFLISEGEWGRLIGEQGIFLGMVLVFLRLGLVTELLIKSWNAVRKNNLFPFIMSSFAAVIVLQGQWAQPTILGFAVMAGGLVLAGILSANQEES